MGRIRRPDGYARTPAGQGDTVEFFLRLEGDVLAECTFETDGCAATVACASAVTELAAGRSARRALAEVTDKEIIRALGGLPEGNLHCAGPVAETFRQAVADALGHKGQTWRKLYRPL
jgi:nitrogen fixation NifU-like protein